jgi:malonyl-CoA/methylmalonyl-CoA synthetase
VKPGVSSALTGEFGTVTEAPAGRMGRGDAEVRWDGRAAVSKASVASEAGAGTGVGPGSGAGAASPVTTEAGSPAWAVHLPTGMRPSDVDLAEGHTLPGAFTRAWAADGKRMVLSTLEGRPVSAAELEERTATAALRYAAAGLVPGDRVLLCATPSIDMVVAYVGALRAGLTVVPANPGYSPAELATLAAAARPALGVLDDPGRLPSPEFPVTTTTLDGLPRRGSGLVLDAAQPQDTAMILYTSGTTGRPKGAPLSHANLLAGAHAVRLAWRWTPDDTLSLCLPLFHMHGLGVGLHGTLVTGATALLHPFSPEAVAAAIDQGASMFFGVPTMYHRLVQSPHLAALSRLRLAVSGSAPLPADLHAAVRAGSGQVVLERYGMTETVLLVSNPYDGQRRPGTVGFPMPGVELRLAPRDGGVTEIEVRGPNVISGYLEDPAVAAQRGTGEERASGSASFTEDGWFRTGDLGTFDEDGYLIISGRAKELIITGGYNVYPREVEELLRTHPAVADAAVVGLPSAEWGETVTAFVVPAGGSATTVDEGRTVGSAGRTVSDPEQLTADLAAWCTEQLVSYKRPRAWYVVDAIPRNALGKIQRHLLVPPS